MPGRGYRADIDGLRAIAVLLVIAFHASPDVCPGGFVGVDVFFVISGYLITGIIATAARERGFSFTHFYARRIRRLVPSLVVVVAATLAAGFFIAPPHAFARLAGTAAATALFGANLLIYRKTGYFDDISANNPLLHMWSLGVEEQFYLIWPLVILLALRLRGRSPAMAVLGGIAGLSLGANIVIAADYPAADFFLLPFRLWELAVGGLLAVQGREPATRLVTGPAGLIGLVLVAAAAWGLSEANTYPGWWAMLPVGGSALLIAAGRQSWVNRVVLAAPPMRFIGLISYQLYLWHWPLLAFVRRTGHGDALGIMAALVATFMLSWATQRFVERPFRFAAALPSWTYRRAVPTLSAGLVGLAVIGLIVPRGQAAFYVRALPSWAVPLATYKFSFGPAYRGKRCFLLEHQGATDFAPDCFAASSSRNADQPVLLLWGDSFAAHLYPGLRVWTAARGFRIAQLTLAGCPPIMDLAVPMAPNCVSTNDFVLHQVASLHPSEVVMAADWVRDFGKGKWASLDWSRLEVTIRRLGTAGVQRIIVLGPLPDWQETLPEVLLAFGKLHPTPSPPQRLRAGLRPEPFQVEPMVRKVALDAGAIYISPLSALCDAEGCRTIVAVDGHVAPVAWDEAHLTTAGSQLLIDLIKSKL